jgi:hypothetical protein
MDPKGLFNTFSISLHGILFGKEDQCKKDL